jgi:hypothetical protein
MSDKPGNYSVSGEALKAVITGPDRAELVSDWTRGKSRGRRTGAGQFELHVEDRPPRGRPGEPGVVADLLTAIRERTGIDAQFEPGIDGRGEDGFVAYPGGHRLILQIVSVPIDQKWGQLCATEKALAQFTAEDATTWIVDAINFKAHGKYARDDQRHMLLALDARHSGILGHPEIIECFRQSRAAQQGWEFAEIWLVGPGVPYSVQLAPTPR